MRKYRNATLLSLLIMLSLVFTTTHSVIAEEVASTAKVQDAAPAEVSSKEEVIYATLNSNGGVKDIYAVNILNVQKEGIVNDYGVYSNLKNLTNTEVLEYNNQVVTAKAPAGRFYYQGTLIDTALPWNININYYLNGTEIPVDQLAGSDGALEMHITTNAKDKNDSFYKNYLLQVSVTLNTDLCKNISAEGATIANAGKNQMLNFTVMPNTDGTIVINTDVTQFEMEGISFSAVPFSTTIEIPDTSEMTSEFTTLTDAIAQLNDGVTKLKDGMNSLSSGSKSLKDGSSDFMGGINTLAGSSKDLTGASKSILEALTYINSNLQTGSGELDLASLSDLTTGLEQLSGGLTQISQGLKDLNTGYAAGYTALSNAIATIPNNSITEEELGALMKNNPNNKTLNQLLENYKAAQTIKQTYQAVSPAFKAVKSNLPVFAESTDTMIQSLQSVQGEISAALSNSDMTSALTELSEGISKLASNYQTFDAGLKEYTAGVSKLGSAYSEVHNGIERLTGGTKKLSEGIGELSAGTTELYKETKNMPEQIETTVEEMMESYDHSEFTPVSFVSSENQKVSLVQFVIKTEKIEKVEAKQQVTVNKEKENFWTRFIKLFS